MGKTMEYFKDIVMKLIRTVLKLFCVLPIKNNRVIFESYMGKQYSCNPKYISEALQKSKKPFEIVWAFEKPGNYHYIKEQGIKVIKSTGILFWIYRLTARVSVTNVMWRNYTPIRKGQYEIQTWHGGGGGYKKTLADDKGEQQKSVTLNRHLKNFERYSLVLTSSATSLRTNARMAMKYKGVVLGGTPRNDMLINHDRPDVEGRVKRYFNIPPNAKLALYAPTWRKGATREDYDIEYKGFKRALKDRFGGEWIVLRRMHWMAAAFFSDSTDDYISAESYPDMQELLYTVDVLVSDYSSSIWDFSFTYKPCFLLCFDLPKYKEDRDFYNPITTWGFPLAQSNEELCENIRSFDEEKYRISMDEQHVRNTSFENGHAAENVCKIIEEVCFGDGKLPEGLPYMFYEDELPIG